MTAWTSLLPAPRVAPPLDPDFRPASLATAAVEAAGGPVVEAALEQADGSIHRFQTRLLDPSLAAAAECNPLLLERWCKFLLWACGGWRLWIAAPAALVDGLRRHYAESPTGRFDSELIGGRVYDHPIQVEGVAKAEELPAARSATVALGRHWEGCRIGFDLGGSDRKVAAVIDGRCVFSEETVWDPYFQADPQYHFDGVMDSLRRAAAHLPRVDAIGGSAAGVYVNNQVRVASLFRGVPPDLFASRVRGLFGELRAAWGGVPFDVVNDGEVTALAGSMSMGQNSVLGLAFGTSTAAGFVTAEGTITSWLNEMAFTPVDFRLDAPRDEWSGDRGCGAQYLSQQAVARLLAPAGVEHDVAAPPAEKLKLAQKLMAEGDERAARIYDTVGVYLGYALGHFATFYPMRHVLALGRVMTGKGGDRLLAAARSVLELEFPAVAAGLALSTPDEKERRHGQAVAAASLPQWNARGAADPVG